LAVGGDMDRAAVVSAVERFLLSKGIAASASTQAAAPGLTQAPAQVESIIADVTADVVNRFLAQRAGSSNVVSRNKPGGYG